MRPWRASALLKRPRAEAAVAGGCGPGLGASPGTQTQDASLGVLYELVS